MIVWQNKISEEHGILWVNSMEIFIFSPELKCFFSLSLYSCCWNYTYQRKKKVIAEDITLWNETEYDMVCLGIDRKEIYNYIIICYYTPHLLLGFIWRSVCSSLFKEEFLGCSGMKWAFPLNHSISRTELPNKRMDGIFLKNPLHSISFLSPLQKKL